MDDNWQEALRVWPDIVRFAQDQGVRITFENCPMIFSTDEWPGGHNIAYSPYIWRRILEAWGDTVGLNFDPSHLVWLMIDQARFIREFGPHILHFQAKDVMIDRDGLYERGTLSGGIGWQVPRIPGLGDAPWAEIFSALYRIGYDGPIIIEHEDKVFEGSDEKVKRGFLVARDVLRPVRQVRPTTEADGVTRTDGASAWLGEAEALLERIATSQATALEAAAGCARRLSRPTGSCTSSARVTRGSRSRRCSRATAASRASIPSSSCR